MTCIPCASGMHEQPFKDRCIPDTPLARWLSSDSVEATAQLSTQALTACTTVATLASAFTSGAVGPSAAAPALAAQLLQSSAWHGMVALDNMPPYYVTSMAHIGGTYVLAVPAANGALQHVLQLLHDSTDPTCTAANQSTQEPSATPTICRMGSLVDRVRARCWHWAHVAQPSPALLQFMASVPIDPELYSTMVLTGFVVLSAALAIAVTVCAAGKRWLPPRRLGPGRKARSQHASSPRTGEWHACALVLGLFLRLWLFFFRSLLVSGLFGVQLYLSPTSAVGPFTGRTSSHSHVLLAISVASLAMTCLCIPVGAVASMVAAHRRKHRLWARSACHAPQSQLQTKAPPKHSSASDAAHAFGIDNPLYRSSRTLNPAAIHTKHTHDSTATPALPPLPRPSLCRSVYAVFVSNLHPASQTWWLQRLLLFEVPSCFTLVLLASTELVQAVVLLALSLLHVALLAKKQRHRNRRYWRLATGLAVVEVVHSATALLFSSAFALEVTVAGQTASLLMVARLVLVGLGACYLAVAQLCELRRPLVRMMSRQTLLSGGTSKRKDCRVQDRDWLHTNPLVDGAGHSESKRSFASPPYTSGWHQQLAHAHSVTRARSVSRAAMQTHTRLTLGPRGQSHADATNHHRHMPLSSMHTGPQPAAGIALTTRRRAMTTATATATPSEYGHNYGHNKQQQHALQHDDHKAAPQERPEWAALLQDQRMSNTPSSLARYLETHDLSSEELSELERWLRREGIRHLDVEAVLAQRRRRIQRALEEEKRQAEAELQQMRMRLRTRSVF